MIVRAFTFSAFHGKVPPAGSTHIRMVQMMKYWPEFDLYKYGEHVDAMIFQKVYCTPDYKFPAHFKGLKILDICDPDWLDGLSSIKETVDAVDAITCSSENLSIFIRQMTDKPVITVPDRFDLSVIPLPKIPKGRAKKVVWFGYRHNAEILKTAMKALAERDLELLVISDDDPFPWAALSSETREDYRSRKYSFQKYSEATIYEDLQTADFCLLPYGGRPQDHFKSSNKMIKATLAGLPVARNVEDLDKFLSASARKDYLEENYGLTKSGYDIKLSVAQYQSLLKQLQK